MIPWIQVNSNILTHDKTYFLAERLRIPNYGAVGIMVSLWAWAAVNAPDGDISKYPKRAIADAAGWNKGADGFYQALLEVRLIERLADDRVVIRNWEQYATLLMNMLENQKRNTADRVKRYRNRQKDGSKVDVKGYNDVSSRECNVTGGVTDSVTCNVTETLCNASTLPNLTLPNQKDKKITPPTPQGEAEGEKDWHSRFSKVVVAKLDEWLQYKAEKRQSYKPTGLKTLLSRAEKEVLKHGEEAVLELIDSSMSSGYQGILWDRLAGSRTGTKMADNAGAKKSGDTKSFMEIMKEEYGLETIGGNGDFIDV